MFSLGIKLIDIRFHDYKCMQTDGQNGWTLVTTEFLSGYWQGEPVTSLAYGGGVSCLSLSNEDNLNYGTRGLLKYRNSSQDLDLILVFTFTHLGSPGFTAKLGPKTGNIDSYLEVSRCTPAVRKDQERAFFTCSPNCFWEFVSISGADSTGDNMCLIVTLLPDDVGCLVKELRLIKQLAEVHEESPFVYLKEEPLTFHIENNSDENLVFDAFWSNSICIDYPDFPDIPPHSKTALHLSSPTGILVYRNATQQEVCILFHADLMTEMLSEFQFGIFSYVPPETREMWQELPYFSKFKEIAQPCFQIHLNADKSVRIRIRNLGDHWGPSHGNPSPAPAANSPTESSLCVVDSEEPVDKIGDFWRETRPRNLKEGVSSGVLAALGGVTAGAGIILTSPYSGAMTGEVGGFFSHVAMGVTSGLAMVGGGLVAGVTQVTRGCLNTVDAIQQNPRVSKWDKVKAEWVDRRRDLTRDVNAAYVNQKRLEEKYRPKSGKVLDTTYYELLGVQTDATDGEIRKAYFKSALKNHPDKHEASEKAQAEETFKELTKAYQVLSDPDRRAKYDTHGRNSSESPNIDPCVFFTTLFGNEVLEKHVGDFYLGSLFKGFLKDLDLSAKPEEARKKVPKAEQAKVKEQVKAAPPNEINSAVNDEHPHVPTEEQPNDDDDDGSIVQAMSRKQLDGIKTSWLENDAKQKIRIVLCANNLRDILKVYTHSTQSSEAAARLAFLAYCQSEAESLVQSTYGVEILHSLGWQYQKKGTKWLAKQVSGLSSDEYMMGWERYLRKRGNQYNMGVNILKSYWVMKAAMDEASVEEPEASEELNDKQAQMQKLVATLQENIPLWLNLGLNFITQDIEDTARKSAQYVLDDSGVHWMVRYKRAISLIILGQVFLEASDRKKEAHTEEDVQSAFQRIEIAFRTATTGLSN